MRKDGSVSAVLDWEFGGAYPLSEVLGWGVDVLEGKDGEGEEENGLWSWRIREVVGERARERGWGEERVGVLMGEGMEEVRRVRGVVGLDGLDGEGVWEG